MNRTVLLVSVLALNGAVLAQTYTTSPRGFEYVEGNSDAYILGAYAAGRFMAFDGEQLGPAMLVKGTAYRLDNRVYTTAQGMGRTWSNVKLWISECDMNALSSTFTANPTTTPAKVFDSTVDWATVSGKPAKLPSDWTLQFPFATNWSYSGNQGICLDYVFTGGTMSNSAAWGASTAFYYYKDTTNPSLYAYTTSTPLGLSGARLGCNDRGVTHLNGAAVSTSAYFYSDTYSNANYRGRLAFSQTGNYFGNSTQVLTLLGFRSLPVGFALPGVYCNNIHIDVSLPVLFYTQFSSGSGSLASLAITGQYGVLAGANAGGMELVTQAAWSDTVNKSLLISSAARLVVPWKPQRYDHKMLYNWNNTATTGSGPYPSATYNAIVRYTN